MGEGKQKKSKQEIQWRFRTFGGLFTEPTQIKFRTRKTEALATFLALTPGKLYSRDSLANIFWPDDRQDTSRQSVRMAVSNIRSVLGENALLSERQAIGLNPKFITSDLAEFETLLEQARSNPDQAMDLRQQAFDISNKPWLPDFNADWVDAQIPKIHEQVSENALQLIALLKAENALTEAIQIAKTTLENSGCREDIHIALMQLYVDSGLTSLAIAQFETLENELDELWGEPPSPAAVAVLESAPRTARENRTVDRPKSIKGLFGRSSELKNVTELLASTNGGSIITLTGTGGTGKTALARAVVKTLEEQSIICHFVDLTTATSYSSALEKILSELKIPNIDPAESLSSVCRFINQKDNVFVFDNLEQLGDDAKSLLDSLLEKCPNVKLLLTSRSPIKLDNELLIPLQPLDLPRPGVTLEEARQSSAVQLFEQQAHISNPNFVVSTQNINSVLELCRRLDGLPLAIKLAAARITIRTPAQILASIHVSLEPIDSNDNSHNERHSSIMSTVRWSFDLLSPEAQNAALLLSVYSGHFNEQTVAKLLLNQNHEAILEELITSSILNVESINEEAEFWFFETVRTSLKTILGNEEEYQSAMSALLQFCISRFDEIESNPNLSGTAKTREHIAGIENTLNCLEFATQQPNFNQGAAQLAINAQRVVTLLNDPRLSACLKKFFEWPDQNVPPALRAHIGCELTHSLANHGEVEKQFEILRRCRELAEDDLEATINVRHCLSNCHKVTGEYQKAIEEMEWVIERTSPNDPSSMANRLYRQGLNYGCLNDRKNTFKYFSEALPHARKAKDTNVTIRLLFDLGSEYAHLKRGDEAIACFVEAEVLCETVGSRKLEGLTRWQHGDALLDLDQPKEALAQLKQSIELVYEGNFPAAEKWIFIKAAEAATRCGYPEIAAKLLGKGAHVRESENRVLAVYEQTYVDDLKIVLDKALGAEKLMRLQLEGIHAEWSGLWQEFALIPSN